MPFRETALTKLLIGSLGGNSMTLMVACCRATSSFATESVRTLQFAMGVKHIRNKPVLVLDAHEKLVHDLRAEIRELKRENGLLRDGVTGSNDGSRYGLVDGHLPLVASKNALSSRAPSEDKHGHLLVLNEAISERDGEVTLEPVS